MQPCWHLQRRMHVLGSRSSTSASTCVKDGHSLSLSYPVSSLAQDMINPDRPEPTLHYIYLSIFALQKHPRCKTHHVIQSPSPTDMFVQGRRSQGDIHTNLPTAGDDHGWPAFLECVGGPSPDECFSFG